MLAAPSEKIWANMTTRLNAYKKVIPITTAHTGWPFTSLEKWESSEKWTPDIKTFAQDMLRQFHSRGMSVYLLGRDTTQCSLLISKGRAEWAMLYCYRVVLYLTHSSILFGWVNASFASNLKKKCPDKILKQFKAIASWVLINAYP